MDNIFPVNTDEIFGVLIPKPNVCLKFIKNGSFVLKKDNET